MNGSGVIVQEMRRSGATTPAIPDKDIEYVKQVYRNEHGTEPH